MDARDTAAEGQLVTGKVGAGKSTFALSELCEFLRRAKCGEICVVKPDEEGQDDA